jgi:probable rRNA maturation factor
VRSSPHSRRAGRGERRSAIQAARAAPASAAASDAERSRSVYEKPWRIDLTVRPGVRPLLSDTALARTAARALATAGAPAPASLGLILSSDAELASLNEAHMGEAGPTDVLSFPLLPPEAFPGHPGRAPAVRVAPAARFVLPPSTRTHLGDIVISVERAIAQAEAGRGGQTGDVRWSPADELRLLVTHGVLHITGWDHADPTEEQAMRALEQRLLRD